VTIAGDPIDVMLPTQELAQRISDALKKSDAVAQVDEITKRISEVFAATSKLPEVQVRVPKQHLTEISGVRDVQARLVPEIAISDAMRVLQARIAENLALTVHATRAAQTGRNP
jgi:antitoxin component of RelBE/YafQ-DinJ toxin-antitoxin module